MSVNRASALLPPPPPQPPVDKVPAPESRFVDEESEKNKIPIESMPTVPRSEESELPSSAPPKNIRPEPKEEGIKSAWGAETDTVIKTTTVASSLADATEKLHSPSDLPEASSLETSSVDGDPLYTKEVDVGLDQLLTEWPLFKKSGLFGTGPKGREHPLFKKVAPLQIPLLLAGRFEGATQEIKQSITDYMNGWRYEQGIIYVQGENFEHYLRRVIRHIIDLQKKKTSV